MSYLENVRDLPEGYYVQIPNEVIYGEEAGVEPGGHAGLITEEVYMTRDDIIVAGKDTAGNRIRYVFDPDTQGWETARVFPKNAVAVENLRPGIVIVSHQGIGEVFRSVEYRGSQVVVSVKLPGSKALNWFFEAGERVDTCPRQQWEENKSDTESLAILVGKIREV